MQWKIRNGETIRFWRDKWLEDEPLLDEIEGEIPEEEMEKKVEDY